MVIKVNQSFSFLSYFSDFALKSFLWHFFRQMPLNLMTTRAYTLLTCSYELIGLWIREHKNVVRTVWKNVEFTLILSLDKNYVKTMQSNLVLKCVDFTKFLRKKNDKNFLQFPHCGTLPNIKKRSLEPTNPLRRQLHDQQQSWCQMVLNYWCHVGLD